MIKYKVVGTLGDAYTILCKLDRIKDDIIVYHDTVHTYWCDEIKDIYSLLPNVKVKFNDSKSDTFLQLQTAPTVNDTNFFPSFKFCDCPVDYSKYAVIQAHAGRDNDPMSRYLSEKTINYLIESLHPIPVILIGTLRTYKSIKNCINLVEQLSILEAMSIVANADGYVGPEGLFTFVALSQKVHSVIFYPRKQVIDKRIIGLPWEDYVVMCVKINNRVY